MKRRAFAFEGVFGGGRAGVGDDGGGLVGCQVADSFQGGEEIILTPARRDNRTKTVPAE